MGVMQDFRFYKKGEEWWMDLPGWEGDPEDLQMIEGADKWLELLSDKKAEVSILLTNENFKDAEMLSLMRIREANFGGGGIYFLENYQGKKTHLKLWLCHVTEFVFGEIPQRIYFKVS
ncbi:MAG: hypothetical protein EOO07_17690 [Chitinophagaceae bacterium]|nr:MAG: hypothetical protein EOO07_17690 [Chitinophagaceae bacterium]